ncbi:phosphoribosyl transferase domain protein [Sphingobacterium spiritivorum ATCC 33300]|uniref:Phosphoribosyl transferase domain protein n=2 Tax=Sphingobacterium spiritivorum TaxID=258 RepID=D7VNF8_SPHSI|nr:phosphoribosyltransferase family protein [Sphingobacterium spiritivorum]EEI93910.1 phosphoribosyl transferase domain protein [Sphingobacterium spiritivorum ATCC 33300]EFK57455.1 phosphoribosyl transferase domain protein [Sphingobacterium spiritivorum ATCC 33861]QQS94468.1 phosphoribosyltransferase [Sphingobacterium spiritivorum]QQT36475.1 phosphoribosyltransferase [Sphingobacterium spiritivorum]WQD33227.1 phosphoribosyltransferase family protein [Sphingobacterium spiritivorum]
MSSKKTLILNKEQIKQKSIRIAYQILEDNFEEKAIVIVGIADRGYIFAQRLQKILVTLAPEKTIELIKVTINKTSRSLVGSTDVAASTAKDKVVILVDDVLNSGRALAYGLGIFLDVPLKKMRTAVLIDRSHHKFPIFSDYYGLKLSTILKEHVEVTLEEYDKTEDAAWLV